MLLYPELTFTGDLFLQVFLKYKALPLLLTQVVKQRAALQAQLLEPQLPPQGMASEREQGEEPIPLLRALTAEQAGGNHLSCCSIWHLWVQNTQGQYSSNTGNFKIRCCRALACIIFAARNKGNSLRALVVMAKGRFIVSTKINRKKKLRGSQLIKVKCSK